MLKRSTEIHKIAAPVLQVDTNITQAGFVIMKAILLCAWFEVIRFFFKSELEKGDAIFPD